MKMRRPNAVVAAALALTLPVVAGVVPFAAPAPARAEDPKKEPSPFLRGALYGQVIDAATGKPVPGATVAVLDRDGKTLAWGRTDDQGKYALPAETLKVLRVEGKRTKGFLEKVAGGVGRAVTVPVKVLGVAADAAVDVVKQIDPIGTAKAAAASAVTGSPAPLAGKVGQGVTRAVQDQAGGKLNTTDAVAEKAVRASLAESISGKSVDGKAAKPKDERTELLPGEALLAVSAPGYGELRGKAGAYWMEPGRASSVGPQAWLETAKIAPAGADLKKTPAIISDMDVRLADPVISYTLVPAGEAVTVAVRVQTPDGAQLPVRVFAREKARGTVAELTRNENGLYAGKLTIPKDAPFGPSEIAVAALRPAPLQVKVGHEKAPDPLLAYAREMDGLDAGRDFAWDPRVFAAVNRIDIPFTILDPKKGNPVDGVSVPAPGGVATYPAAPPTPPPPAPAPAPAPAPK